MTPPLHSRYLLFLLVLFSLSLFLTFCVCLSPCFFPSSPPSPHPPSRTTRGLSFQKTNSGLCLCLFSIFKLLVLHLIFFLLLYNMFNYFAFIFLTYWDFSSLILISSFFLTHTFKAVNSLQTVAASHVSWDIYIY